MLTRMRLVASGMHAASIPFGKSPKNAVMELLVTGTARKERKMVASYFRDNPRALSKLRGKDDSGGSDRWALLQSSLFGGGFRFCPTSGNPVVNVRACSVELVDVLWKGLVAIAGAVNKKGDAADFESAMSELSRHVFPHVSAIAPPSPSHRD